MLMKCLSTREVAEKVGISRATLERWLAIGKLRTPRVARVGKGTVRFWAAADVKGVLKYKQLNYCKGRGRKKGQKMKGRRGK